MNISSLIVSDDAFSIDTVVPGQISCNTLLIDGVNIDTQIANATSNGITQADLDTKQNFINDGDLSFAKTSGLQAAINSLDKLASIIYVNTQLNKNKIL